VFGERLLPSDAATIRRPDPHDRAAALGRLALAAWTHGASVDPAAALPVSLRDLVAQTSAQRAAAAAARRAAAAV
jgi:tRNA threonylcarbamoyladenosine biosynthesis protein TsaB